jgi:hypothetical protein
VEEPALPEIEKVLMPQREPASKVESLIRRALRTLLGKSS